MIEKIANRTLLHTDENWNMNIETWDWVPGVGLYGISRAGTYYEACNAYIDAWMARNLEKSAALLTVNSTAPFLSLLECAQRTDNAEYLTCCRRMAEHILNEAPRTVDGGLEHTVTEGVVFHDQMWADTLFMVCIFMARMGAVTQNDGYLQFAQEQLRLHYQYLQDKKTGICYHGWDGASRTHMSGCYWGRANAWMVASTAEILEAAGAFDSREKIVADYQRLVAALIASQTAEGGIRTLVDDASSYIETSATAGFAYGVMRGVYNGYLPDTCLTPAKKAAAYVMGQVAEDGSVNGVSTGTPIMKDAQAYRDIPLCPTLYGQGLALLMLCELKRVKQH